MSQLLALKERIRTIKNLHKVTSAMELVTQTRINKVRTNAACAKNYQSIMSGLFAPVVSDRMRDVKKAPARSQENVRHVLVGFLSQKGFCGNFNDRVLGKMFIRLAPLRMHKNVDVILVGRRSSKWDYVLKRPFTHIEGHDRTYREEFVPFIDSCVKSILAGTRLELYFVYNEFVTILQQTPVVKQVFPFEQQSATSAKKEIMYEPDAAVLFPALLKAYIEASVEQVYWEAQAGEYCSRLITMKNANDNATLITAELQLTYNKTRQAKITQELSEIVSAFDVLKMSKDKKEQQDKAA